jgi:hypothetical protein
VSISSLTRWSGMVAMLGATLFIVASLVALFVVLFFFDPTAQPSDLAITAFYLRSFLVLFSQALLVLGLVGLYVRQSAAMGVIGLVSFLVTFFGLVASLASIPLGDLVEAFGWALFGVVTLQARVYPRPAAILLIIGALATGFFSSSSSLESLGEVGAYLGVISNIVLNVAIAWMGYSLFTQSEDSIAEHS